MSGLGIYGIACWSTSLPCAPSPDPLYLVQINVDSGNKELRIVTSFLRTIRRRVTVRPTKISATVMMTTLMAIVIINKVDL